MKDQPLDYEFLSQCEIDFSNFQEWINFAVAVVNAGNLTPELEEMALDLLGTYGEMKGLDVPPLFTVKLLIANYGVEEFEAMGEHGDVKAEVWQAYLEGKCAYYKDCHGEGKHQCPKCKKMYCDACREMWLPVDPMFWVQTAMMCPQCHYNTYA